MTTEHEEKQAAPEWFVKAVWFTHDLYPGLMPGKTTVKHWWQYLRDLPEQAVRGGFRLAVKASPDRCPTAPQIRAHAEAVAKTLDTPRADLSLPALPEPELTLPPDNPFAEKLEQYKRGETPKRIEEVKQAVRDFMNAARGAA